MSPEQRRQFIHDQLAKRGKILDLSPAKLTPEQKTQQIAKEFWIEIDNKIRLPFLRSLKSLSDYHPAATQQMLLDAFVSKFCTMSKDELVILVSIMHMEVMEQQMASQVNAGLCGPDMDIPI